MIWWWGPSGGAGSTTPAGTPTYNDLITAALQDLGVVPSGNMPSPDDSSLGLARLNEFIDTCKAEGLTIPSLARTTWTMTSGVASYTIGPGATINTDRPVSPQDIGGIGYVNTAVTPNYERGLDLLTDDAYQATPLKSLTSLYPSVFYYRATVPNGTLLPLPIPTAGNLLGVIYTNTPLGEVLLTDTVVVAPGFRRFFRSNLCIELAAAFGVTNPPPSIVKTAEESRCTVKRANVRMEELVVDAALWPGRAGTGNVYSG